MPSSAGERHRERAAGGTVRNGKRSRERPKGGGREQDNDGALAPCRERRSAGVDLGGVGGAGSGKCDACDGRGGGAELVSVTT